MYTVDLVMLSPSASTSSLPTKLLSRTELLPYKNGEYLWKYVPSLPLAAIFAALFLVASLAHTWKMIRHRLWFCLPFALGGYLEAFGCAARILSRYNSDKLIPFVIQGISLLIPPSLFAASIYMTLGRIMRGLGTRGTACSIIRVKWLTTIFVVGDVFAFNIQGSGAPMLAKDSTAKMGKILVIVGLVVQIAFFGLFVVAAIIFDMRYRRGVVSGFALVQEGQNQMNVSPFNWQKLMMMLYATSALILVRCVFRIIEYVMGPDGYLLTNEWPLYVFDLALMVVTMVLFYIWYPSMIKPLPENTESGSMELLPGHAKGRGCGSTPDARAN